MPRPAPISADSPLRQYLSLAADQSAALVARTVAEAVRAQAQLAIAAPDFAERNRLAFSAKALNWTSQTVAAAFPTLLREEIEIAAGAEAPTKALSFGSLELMGEDQVNDTVELLRGQQAAMAAVEAELAALDALVSAAQGHERVVAAANPLRPEIWIRALHRALGQARALPAERAGWMVHLGRALGPELAVLYRNLSESLTRDGVSAAGYRITLQDEPRRRLTGDAAGPTLHDLKHLLANVVRGEDGTRGLSRPAGESMNGMTMPAAVEALHGMKQMDDVVRRMQDRWRKGVWQPEAASPGAGAEADGKYSPTQTLAREVARLMIANVASDERLLPDVQQAVRELEPALLRLVQHDQRFFVDRQHPARQLLEEMTQRSLAWPQRNTPGFLGFLEPLREAVQMLAQMPIEDEQPFQFAGLMLRQSWDEAEERTRRQRGSMARTLMQADKRSHAAGSGSPEIVAAQGGGAVLQPNNQLTPGQYVEVLQDGQWTRQRMTWASPHGVGFIFVDASGNPESMTRDVLAQLLDSGVMRLLASGSVVDGALDAVAQTALENSTQLPL